MTGILVSALVGLLGIGVTAALSGTGWALFVDVPTLVVVVVFPVVYQLVMFGMGATARAFAAPTGGGGTAELKSAHVFFTSFGKAVWLFAAFAVAAGAIAMLAGAEDHSLLPNHAAILFIAPLYAAVVNLLLVWPYATSLARRLAEKE